MPRLSKLMRLAHAASHVDRPEMPKNLKCPSAPKKKNPYKRRRPEDEDSCPGAPKKKEPYKRRRPEDGVLYPISTRTRRINDTIVSHI